MTDVQGEQIEKSETNTEKPAKRNIPNTFRALKHRNFQLIFAGQLVLLTGMWMQPVNLLRSPDKNCQKIFCSGVFLV